MLKTISVENYRSFRTSAELELKPLTILLGRNSSGKSSLTRLFPLLQQSIDTPSSTPILWSADQVDLGNIVDVISHGSQEPLKIGLTIKTNRLNDFISRQMFHRPLEGRHKSRRDTLVSYEIFLSRNDLKSSFDGMKISIDGHSVKYLWDSLGRVTKIFVDGRSYPLDNQVYTVTKASLFPYISKKVPEEALPRFSRGGVFHDAVIDALAEVIHGRTADEKVFDMAATLPYIAKRHAIEVIRDLPNSVSSKITKAKASRLSDLSLINSSRSIIEFLEFHLSTVFSNLGYIRPVRASGQRFDRIQELAVNKIDSSGENTAMYIYSLSKKERESFNALLLKACGYSVSVQESGPGHVSIKIGSDSTGDFENIADVGFGFSQLLPVIAQLHAQTERSEEPRTLFHDQMIFAVEQPELHLHPGLQSNLADLFAGVFCDQNTSLQRTAVIETHSETMISRLGELVANGSIPKDTIAIYFVEKNEKTGNSHVRQTAFDNDGIITDWPIGFFSRS